MTARFLAALLGSLLLHLALLAGPAWHLPRFEPPSPSPPGLAATLRSPSVQPDHHPVPARNRFAPPRQETTNRPIARVRENSSAAPVADTAATAIADLPAEESLPAPSSPLAAAETLPLPEADSEEGGGSPVAEQASVPQLAAATRALRLVFVVTRGEGGFVVGRAEHRLRIADGEYRIATELATTGLAALFRPVQVSQHSAGQIEDGVLKPLTFRSERRGQSEETRFDWPTGQLLLADGRTLALPAWTQDLLSLFYQLALIEGEAVELPVTTGRKLERYRFENAGEVLLETPFGSRRALHWRSQGAREATEVWLGIEERLPLKIRHIDRRGDVFDQNIEHIVAEESAS